MTDMLLKIYGAQAYSFTDDKSGRLVQGVNVFHMVKGDDINSVGEIPSKINLPYETWSSIQSFPFPCTCKVKTEQVFGRKGIVTKVTGLEFVK